jgi:hypothetical protein
LVAKYRHRKTTTGAEMLKNATGGCLFSIKRNSKTAMGRQALFQAVTPVQQPDVPQSAAESGLSRSLHVLDYPARLSAERAICSPLLSGGVRTNLRFAVVRRRKSGFTLSVCANHHHSSTFNSCRIDALEFLVLTRCADANGPALCWEALTSKQEGRREPAPVQEWKQGSMLGDDRTAPAVVHANRPDVRVLAKGVDP